MENLTFGVEIEYRDLSREYVTAFIKEKYPEWESKKEDAIIKTSINPILGGEVVSPVLTDAEETWQELDEICYFFIQNKASSVNTGAHIHIGANIFENNSIYFLRFIKLWCAYEHIIYRFCYGDYIYARDTLFEYSSPVSKELKFLIETLKLSEQDSFDYLVTVLNLGKKKGLNLSNINHNPNKNTIEFRCPNGTFNKNVWHNNFLLFKRIIKYAKSDSYNEALINNKLLLEYDITDNKIIIEDAIGLASLIYPTQQEKLLFLKQYLKGKEETKEYTLSRKQKC